MLRGRAAYTGLLSIARNVLTPPFVAVVGGVVLKMVFLQFDLQMPALVLDVTKLVGSATVPLAMVVLGGMLAEAQWGRDFEPRAVVLMTTVKLIVLPAFGLFFVKSLQNRFDPVFAFVMMLEAVSPAATNISLAAKRFGANTSFVAVTLFVTYLLSMITIPLWLSALYH
jgi:malate permease and related proteins